LVVDALARSFWPWVSPTGWRRARRELDRRLEFPYPVIRIPLYLLAPAGDWYRHFLIRANDRAAVRCDPLPSVYPCGYLAACRENRWRRRSSYQSRRRRARGEPPPDEAEVCRSDITLGVQMADRPQSPSAALRREDFCDLSTGGQSIDIPNGVHRRVCRASCATNDLDPAIQSEEYLFSARPSGAPQGVDVLLDALAKMRERKIKLVIGGDGAERLALGAISSARPDGPRGFVRRPVAGAKKNLAAAKCSQPGDAIARVGGVSAGAARSLRGGRPVVATAIPGLVI